MSFSNVKEVNRRQLLKGGASVIGLAGATYLSGGSAAFAAGTLNVVVVNAALNGPLRTALETASGATINDAPWQNTTDVVSRIMAPGGTSQYDVLIAGTDFVRPPIMGQAAGDERVLALDPAKLPNLDQLADVFQAEVTRRDDNVYMVPVFWGFDSVVYNRDKIPEDDPFTQSWAPLFEDKYAGRIAWIDAAHQMFMAAGLYLGMAAPENMEDKEIEEVTAFLIDRKKNVRTLYSGFASAVSLIANGEVDCLHGPIPVRVELQTKGFNVTNAWPKEGVLSFTHSAFIPKDSASADAAHGMINGMLGAEYAGQVTRICGYLSTSKQGTSDLTPDEYSRFGYGVLDGTVKAHGMGFPANISKMIEGWNQVKST